MSGRRCNCNPSPPRVLAKIELSEYPGSVVFRALSKFGGRCAFPLTVRLLDIYCHTLYVGSRVVFIGVVATGTIRENVTERTAVFWRISIAR